MRRPKDELLTQPRRQANNLQQRQDEAKSQTSHRLITIKSGGLHCKNCLARSAPSARAKIKFMTTPCGHKDLTMPDQSHHLCSKSHVIWCTKCGAWSGRNYRALTRTCVGAPWSSTQKKALKLFAAGHMPEEAKSFEAKTSSDELEIVGEPIAGLWGGIGVALHLLPGGQNLRSHPLLGSSR